MDKSALLQRVISRLEEQLTIMQKAAKNSHVAATGNESKSEGKYDTRGIEASYLAGAQTEQCEKITEAIRILDNFTPVMTDQNGFAQAGSVIESESDGEISHYFLLPCGGGISIDHEGCEITTLTPDTPLYQAFLGNSIGNIIEPQDLLILDIF